MMAEFVAQIRKVISDQILRVHTILPGEIVEYDSSKGVAKVKPLALFDKPNGGTVPYPEISDVPVVCIQTFNQNTTIALPIKPKDGCLILFCEKSLDFWRQGHETDTRLNYDLSNAICLPGLFVNLNGVVKEACDQEAIILKNKDTKITMKNDLVKVETTNVEINAQNATIKGDSIGIVGETSITGNLNVSGIVTASAFVP